VRCKRSTVALTSAGGILHAGQLLGVHFVGGVLDATVSCKDDM